MKPKKEKYNPLEIKQEINRLKITKDNPERLQKLIAELDYFYWGIKS